MHANLLFRVRRVSEWGESFSPARSYKPPFAITVHPSPNADWKGRVLARNVARTPVSARAIRVLFRVIGSSPFLKNVLERFIPLVTRPIVECHLCYPMLLPTFMGRFCCRGAFWLHVVPRYHRVCLGNKVLRTLRTPEPTVEVPIRRRVVVCGRRYVKVSTRRS